MRLARLAPLWMMVAAGGCGPASAGPPDGGPPLVLEVLTPPGDQIGLHYGKSIELRVRYHTADAAASPVADQTVRFSIFGDPAGSTLAHDQSTTDPTGLATVTLTGGQAEATFSIAATAANAPEADVHVSVSKLDFVELDVELGWSTPPSSTTLRALLYDDRTCGQLPASPTLPPPFRALSKSGASTATLQFLNLLSRRYAIVGRAEDPTGRLDGYGCVDIGAELAPPGSVSTLPVTLTAAIPSPASSFLLSSMLLPAPSLWQPAVSIWQTFGDCPYGAAQMLLDAMAVTSHRDPPMANACRPTSTVSLDKQLQDLLSAPPMAPANALAYVADDLENITASSTLKSTLVIAATGPNGLAATHSLVSLAFVNGASTRSYDLVQLGQPVIVAHDIATTDDGTTLTLANHGFTLGWGALWKQALVDMSLTVRLPTLGTPPVQALVVAVVQAASRNGKSGCAAVEDLACSIIGGTPCNLQALCTSAIDQVAAELDAPFAPSSGIDLQLQGSALAVDSDGDLVVDMLEAGSWVAPGLSPSSFVGTRP